MNLLGPHSQQEPGAASRQDGRARAALDDGAAGTVGEREDVHGRRADEARDEDRGGARVELGGRGVLLDAPVAQEDDLVGHAHGLGLVVRDVHHRDAELLLEAADLAPHLETELGVEVGERLVHEAHGRLGDDGAAERHALLLASREL